MNRPPLPIGKSPIALTDGRIEIDDHGHVIGRAVRQCYDNVHVFADIGDCQCGKETWTSPSFPDKETP